MPIDAIKSSNVTFGKKAKGAEEKDAKVKKQSFASKLTQPIKDSFHRKYGKDAKPTPTLVADYAADKLIKIGVLTLGTIAIFKKMKSSTNGLTQALSDAKANKDVKGIGAKISEALKQVKKNNLETLEQGGREALEGAKGEAKGIIGTIKESIKNIFNKKDFDYESSFGKTVKRVFGKRAEKVGTMLGKIGVGNGKDFADLTMAAGGTIAVASGVNNIADDVTTSDDEKLAEKSSLHEVKKKVHKHIDEIIDFNDKLTKAADTIGIDALRKTTGKIGA